MKEQIDADIAFGIHRVCILKTMTHTRIARARAEASKGVSKEVIDNAFFVPEVAAPAVDKKSAALPMINASLFTAQDKGDNPNNPFGDDFSSNPNAAAATTGKKVRSARDHSDDCNSFFDKGRQYLCSSARCSSAN